MESELLAILDQLERDKGIKRDTLIEAVEAAVASAARKVWTVDKEEDVEAKLDPLTGKIRAYASGEEIRGDEFGRIAAQTAKQVIFQKIREAEKDVVFSEYSNRIGEIVSGSIYRFDKGNIIVDLGKAEAIIPRSEQSRKEEFRQGERIRAYIADVRRETRGPQVVLSRSNPNFVKRLFELEVPEIFEGIIEVKSIAREPGERTKISVYSKDEKIDCVGACVGMRGSRVKNIVNELHGEKIDIVRYAPDIKEYVQAALSPAEISQMQLLIDEQKINIIVAEDQLSLAIGKFGQNVRLASRLVEWELDIFSPAQWEEYLNPSSESSDNKEGDASATTSNIKEASSSEEKLEEEVQEDAAGDSVEMKQDEMENDDELQDDSVKNTEDVDSIEEEHKKQSKDEATSDKDESEEDSQKEE